MPIDTDDRLDRVVDSYADAIAADTQPPWVDDLRDAHDAIGTVFVRTRGPLPFPQVELKVYDQIGKDTGWHRLELETGH